MAQVTIYIPNELEGKVKNMAASLNVSISKFISTILEQKVNTQWNDSSKKLAGSWDNFPSLEEIRASEGKDCIKEAF